MDQPSELVQHFFRHEYGRLVAILSRQFGSRRIDLVEDAIQNAMMRAMQTWSRQGVPSDPAGWLYRTARNNAVDLLRRETTLEAILTNLPNEPVPNSIDLEPVHDIANDQLRMLFLCCHESLSMESQIALALKLVAGFGVDEIAAGLLTTPANIQKRLTRAKETLREIEFDPSQLPSQELLQRRDAVHTVLYLIFNEGYQSSQQDDPIRIELCQEAIRLTGFLIMQPNLSSTATEALYALMLLHAARFDARIDSTGEILRLEDQDRSTWNQDCIANGLGWLERSARGENLSKYHIEAAIVAEHCRVKHFRETDWGIIVSLYDLLIQIEANSLHSLNRAIAIAFLHGPQAGLRSLQAINSSKVMENYRYWHSAMAELYRRSGQNELAIEHYEIAIERTDSLAEQKLLLKQVALTRANMIQT
jgi:RNA polymerase sigma factor (sigma-70 family)